MQYPFKLLLTIIVILFSTRALAAVNIVECQDQKGDRSYQNSCPPGYTQINKKKIRLTKGGNDQNKSSDIKVTLYVIPECESCDEVREFLETRNISIVEKNVHDNFELQSELTASAGALNVPTTIINEDIITGYNRSKLIDALKKAGFEEKAR